jgi:hypothetical protein
MLVGRFWFNDRKIKKDIEIDHCVLTKKGVFVYECKWTKDKVTLSHMNTLKTKGEVLNAIGYGAFSRSGFSENLSTESYDLINVDDMFDMTK